MREIKFKAWSKERKEWLDRDGSTELHFELVDPHLANQPRLELSLYTGLKDKNGKEIYEGDITQMAGKVRQPRWEIVWYENGWQMKLVWIKGRLPEHYYVKLSSDKVIEFDEVIGNIYENPELLK